MSKGWKCPKCGSIYAPFRYECIRCNTNGVSPKEICEDVCDDPRETQRKAHNEALLQANKHIYDPQRDPWVGRDAMHKINHE